MKFTNLINQTFGKLTVVSRATSRHGKTFWNCVCSCGNTIVVCSTSLRSGHKTRNRNCGCLLNAKKLFWSARSRAKVKGLFFNLDLDDVIIPKKCPLLNIDLCRGVNRVADTSPTLDRIRPEYGYIKGNVLIISQRANRIKNNSNSVELRKIADALEYYGG